MFSVLFPPKEGIALKAIATQRNIEPLYFLQDSIIYFHIIFTYAQTLRAKWDIKEFSSIPHFKTKKIETQISKMICSSHGLEDPYFRNINYMQ